MWLSCLLPHKGYCVQTLNACVSCGTMALGCLLLVCDVCYADSAQDFATCASSVATSVTTVKVLYNSQHGEHENLPEVTHLSLLWGCCMVPSTAAMLTSWQTYKRPQLR